MPGRMKLQVKTRFADVPLWIPSWTYVSGAFIACIPVYDQSSTLLKSTSLNNDSYSAELITSLELPCQYVCL